LFDFNLPWKNGYLKHSYRSITLTLDSSAIHNLYNYTFPENVPDLFTVVPNSDLQYLAPHPCIDIEWLLDFGSSDQFLSCASSGQFNTLTIYTNKTQTNVSLFFSYNRLFSCSGLTLSDQQMWECVIASTQISQSSYLPGLRQWSFQ